MKDKIKRFTTKYLNIKYIMPFVLIFSLSFAMLFNANADYVTVTSTADRFSIDDSGNNFDFPITLTSASLSSKFYSYKYQDYPENIIVAPFYFYIYFPRSFPSASSCGVDLDFWYVSCDPDGSDSLYLTSATPFYYQLGYYSESSDGNEVNFEWVTNSVSFPNASLNVVADAANNGYPASGLGWISPYGYNSFHGSFTSSEEFNVIRIAFNPTRTRPVVSFCFNQCVIQATYYDDGAGGDTSSDTSSDTDTDTDTDSGGGSDTPVYRGEDSKLTIYSPFLRGGSASSGVKSNTASNADKFIHFDLQTLAASGYEAATEFRLTGLTWDIGFAETIPKDEEIYVLFDFWASHHDAERLLNAVLIPNNSSFSGSVSSGGSVTSTTLKDVELDWSMNAQSNGPVCIGPSWPLDYSGSEQYSNYSFFYHFTSPVDFDSVQFSMNFGDEKIYADLYACFNQAYLTVGSAGGGDTGGGGSGGGDTGGGGSGGDSSTDINVSVVFPETDQPEINNGLDSANDSLQNIEDTLNSAFNDALGNVDLDINGAITDDVLTSTNFFAQLMETCFNGLPWLNTMVTVSLIIGGAGVLLGLIRKGG